MIHGDTKYFQTVQSKPLNMRCDLKTRVILIKDRGVDKIITSSSSADDFFSVN